MFKQLLLIFLVFGVFPSSFWAQTNPLDEYDRTGIYLRTEFWRGTVYVQNGKFKPLGFAYKNLKPEFEKSPNILPMFRKAQRNEKTSFVIGILGWVGATAGVIMAFNSVDNQGYIVNERRYKQGANLVLGSAVISAALIVPLKIRSRQQLADAIWLRNRALLEN